MPRETTEPQPPAELPPGGEHRGNATAGCGGNGTQGKRLTVTFSAQHVSSGEVLCAEARVGTPVGRKLAYQERHAADKQRSRMA